MDTSKKVDHRVHTTPNHHPTKRDVLPKTFLQINLAAKWLERHSSTSPQPTATTFALISVYSYILLLWLLQDRLELFKTRIVPKIA